MSSIHSLTSRLRNRFALVLLVVGVVVLVFSFGKASINNVNAIDFGEPFDYRYVLDVLRGIPTTVTEVEVSARYVVKEYPRETERYKLNARSCVLGSIQELIVQADSAHIESFLKSMREEMQRDVVACMFRLRGVTVESLKLEFHGVKHKGPYKRKPLPERPELPTAPQEETNLG